MKRASRAVVAGLAAGGLAGCGSSGYAPTDLRTAPPPPAATAPGGDRTAVRMKGLAFRPPAVTTRVGRAVEWINRDDVRHNVTSLDGASITSPDLPPGGRFVYVPARAGELRYSCTIHPTTMSGLLIVTAG